MTNSARTLNPALAAFLVKLADAEPFFPFPAEPADLEDDFDDEFDPREDDDYAENFLGRLDLGR